MYKVQKPLDHQSRALRGLILDALEGGGRGHVGPSMSLVEILRVLYSDFLRHRPQEPRWPDRDRLILSKGHGCLALYAVLAHHGYFSPELLRTFCHPNSPLGGHPERGDVPGIEASTGSLGHGLSLGVGLALAVRMQGRNSRVAVVTGDGELAEGSIWEAALSAAKHRLSNLSVFVDHNKMQVHGTVQQVTGLGNLRTMWQSFGFEVFEVDGHDVEALRQIAQQIPPEPERPTAVICHTVKGRGIRFAEQNVDWHYRFTFTPAEIALMRGELAFEDPHAGAQS
jgi:transketolase